MSLQSPLNKVLGLGSARQGSGHWWAQRLTAIGLVPLTIWFAVALLGIQFDDYESVAAWIADPLHAILLIMLVIAVVYHSHLGLLVIIEDYVHGGMGVAVRIVFQFLHVVLAVAGIYAVLVISVGAGT